VAEAIVSSQSFDNATLCCSEQALVLDEPVAAAVLAELQARGAHLCSDAERALLETYCNQGGHMNPDIVGLDPWRVAEGAGFSVPRSTTVLLAHQDGVGPEHPLSIEILCPLLSVHVVDGWHMGCEVATSILHNGGLGHTMAVHAREESVLDAFFLEKPANRIIVNGPSSAGAVGFSTHLTASFSLGCGPQAGNITSDNITARHLINVKRAAYPRRDWREIERKAHERAAALTGAGMPRGSGLPGDPALGRGGHVSTERATAPAPQARPSRLPVSELRPAATASASTGNSASAVQTIVTLRPAKAPTFTRPGTRPVARAVRAGARSVTKLSPQSSQQSSQQSAGTEVGSALSVGEIRSMFENAGAGCPMGPCQGCSLHNVRTGQCEA
jgi:hypothetical protein